MKEGIAALIVLLLLAGCTQNPQPVATKPVPKKVAPVQPKPVVKPVASKPLPTPPKKNIKLKTVDDNNFNPEYMYPEDKKTQPEVSKPVQVATTPSEQPSSPSESSSAGTMSKEECIAMITQEKFDKYTTMFGSEAASIKRCQMLKAMQ